MSLTLRMLCAAVTCAAAPAACKKPDRGPDVQVGGETLRVRAGDPVPKASPWFDGSRVTLAGARGETLGMQILHRDKSPVSLSLDGAAVAAFAVEPVTVKRSSTRMYGGGRGPGAYPDVLVRAQAPASNPAYFDIAIASDAKPGTHAGELVIGDRHIPVTLEVAPVTVTLPLGVWAYEDPRELGWAGLGESTVAAPSDAERACIATFRSYGVMLSPDLPAATWPARKDLLAGFPFVPAVLPDEPAAVGEAVRAWIANTQGTGQVPFAIPIDEPHQPEARAKVRALAEAARAAGSGPGKFLFAVTDEPRPEYGDVVDLFITLRAKLADRVMRWTYNGAPPHAGSMVVDAATGPRTWGWIGYRWGIGVWYVWDALYWHDRHNRKGAPLPGRALDVADVVSFDDGEDHGNLDGVLALPGDRAQPCRPTLRLAALRRGLQDRALLELAAKCKPEAVAKLAEQLVPRALGDAPDDSGPSWPGDEVIWEKAHRLLLEIATSCATGPDRVPSR